MATTQGAISQAAGLVVYKPTNSPSRLSQIAGMAVYPPDPSRNARVTQIAALVVFDQAPYNTPVQSEVAALVVWAPGAQTDNRSRAWTFILDGHTFYVLDLGAEGTFLYDTITQEWCQFQTEGYTGWNFRNGITWGSDNRIVGADTLNALVWELIPDLPLDEGFKEITHTVTGGVATRSRAYISCSAVTITGSMGAQDSVLPVDFKMRFSDDGGNTWSDYFVSTMVPEDYGGEAAWRSLGSFNRPGRVFEFTEAGGMLRVDGADVYLGNFTDDTQQGDNG